MKVHRIREVVYPEDDVPAVFIELTENTWLPMDITNCPLDELHQALHNFMDKYNLDKKFFISYDTRCFSIMSHMRDFKELDPVKGD